jgi:hypothetical protein
LEVSKERLSVVLFIALSNSICADITWSALTWNGSIVSDAL